MLKRVALGYLLVFMASCVPTGSSFRPVAGLRGAEVTVALDPLAEGEKAPTLEAVPLTPVEVDLASLPALDAITNPLLIDPAAPAALIPPDPMAVQVSNQFAILNAGPAMQPYAFVGRTGTDGVRAQLCLTAAIYYEAATESDDGQRAVAQVVLNRVRHPAYPNTVCDVVYQGTERGDRLCQFSFACDGSLARIPNRAAWARASRVARAALAGYVYAPAGTATHYHTHAVNPVWNKSLTSVAIIGAHIFYRWPGAPGTPGAFYSRYTGREPVPAPRAHPVQPLGPAPLIAGAAGDASFAALQAQLVLQQRAAADAALVASAVAMKPARPVAQDNRYVSGALPESDVRPEFSQSGQWIRK
jgi:Cell Wall Hydrolase